MSNPSEEWTDHGCVPFLSADISAIAKIYGKPLERDGETFMSVEKMLVDFTMKNARFKVKDNVNTQNVLGECRFSMKPWTFLKPYFNLTGEAINQFLNQNANELIQEMRPAASQSIAKLFRRFLNDAFSNIPMRLWLLEN